MDYCGTEYIRWFGLSDQLIRLNYFISVSLFISRYFFLAVFYIKKSRFQILLTASLWVSLEYIRAIFITGFPWCLLGYSQFKHITLIQITDLVGVYGLSFLIVVVNGLLYFLLFSPDFSFRKKILRWDAVVVLLMMITTMLYGHFRLQGPHPSEMKEDRVKVVIIQGNIDQSKKWDPEFRKQTIDRYRSLTLSTMDFKPDLVVWPETSVPLFFQKQNALSKIISHIPIESDTSLIFGCPAYEMKIGITQYFNRVYLLSPKGVISGYYDKMHLVPFGEYVPLKRFLPFINRLVHAAGDFTPGKQKDPLQYRNIAAGTLICFEGIFPELSRSQVNNGANILINVTNDAWYGMTSAPHQHLCMAIFRAVENKRWLIRSANTGISAFVDPYGRVAKKGSLFDEEVLTQEIQTIPSLTIYNQYGDFFVFIILAICLIHFSYTLCYHRFKRHDT